MLEIYGSQHTKEFRNAFLGQYCCSLISARILLQYPMSHWLLATLTKTWVIILVKNKHM